MASPGGGSINQTNVKYGGNQVTAAAGVPGVFEALKDLGGAAGRLKKEASKFDVDDPGSG